jgi:hypothetical protein
MREQMTPLSSAFYKKHGYAKVEVRYDRLGSRFGSISRKGRWCISADSVHRQPPVADG